MTDGNKEFYAHRGEACDGVWFKVFPTQQQATDSLLEYYSTSKPASSIKLNRTYVDNYGSTHLIFAVPCGKTAKDLEDHEEAYDNREMGIATEEQLELLARW